MARKFLSALDLNKNELQNVALQNLSSAPSTPATGQIYFNTTDKTHYVYSGTAWLKFVPSGQISNADIASDAAIALSKLATDPLARANHTGTQASSTISDLASVVKAYKLNEFGAPTADVSMNSYKITSVATPTADNDAANKKYVDDAVAGLTWKESVHLLATANIPLTGNTNTVTIDSHATLTSANSGYRLLLTGQTTAADKGIYDYIDNGTTYTLTRSSDSDTVAELVGATVFVMEGTGYGKTSWTQSNTYLATFSGQSWVQFSGASAASAGAGMVANGNAFDVVGTTNRITVNADSIDISSSYVGQTSITTLGTIATGTWNGSTLDVAHGGTGATTLTGYVKGSGTAGLTASSTIPGSDISGDITGNAANVNGTVAVANGGTGATTLSTGGYLKGAGTGAITSQTGIPAGDITSGTLGVARGGTGVATLTGYAKGTGTSALSAVTTIPVADGGTGASTAAGARTNLSSTASALPQKYSATNGSLTASSGVITWTIAASTHGLGAVGSIIVQMKEVSSGAVVDADIIVNESTGDITISWNSASNVTSGTYRITAIG